MRPVSRRNRHRLYQDAGFEENVISEATQVPEQLPIIASLRQHQSEVGITMTKNPFMINELYLGLNRRPGNSDAGGL
jgi:hypothetical protein